MKTSQALLVCGCFAEGIATAFEHGDKFYRLILTVEGGNHFFELNIIEIRAKAKFVSFPIADIGVDDGYLRFDLGAEIELRIPLEDYEEGEE